MYINKSIPIIYDMIARHLRSPYKRSQNHPTLLDPTMAVKVEKFYFIDVKRFPILPCGHSSNRVVFIWAGNQRYRDTQMASFLNQSESAQMHLIQSNSFNTARYHNSPTHAKTNLKSCFTTRQCLCNFRQLGVIGNFHSLISKIKMLAVNKIMYVGQF